MAWEDYSKQNRHYYGEYARVEQRAAGRPSCLPAGEGEIAAS